MISASAFDGQELEQRSQFMFGFVTENVAEGVVIVTPVASLPSV